MLTKRTLNEMRKLVGEDAADDESFQSMLATNDFIKSGLGDAMMPVLRDFMAKRQASHSNQKNMSPGNDAKVEAEVLKVLMKEVEAALGKASKATLASKEYRKFKDWMDDTAHIFWSQTRGNDPDAKSKPWET